MAYGAVDRQTWNDEKFRSWDRDVRDVWLYLLTCPHGNRIGCFVLSPLYVADDVQISTDQALECLEFLHGEGRIVWHGARRVCCIVRYLHPEYNPLANESVAKAARKDVQELPYSERGLRALLDACDKWGKPYYEPFTESVRQRLRDHNGHGGGHGGGHGDGDSVPHQDQYQYQEKQPTTSARARLRDWLGDHADVVGAFEARFGSGSSTWAAAVWGHYVSGTKEEAWDGIPPPDRPTILAATMWSYIGDASEYDNRLFRRYLDRQVREYWEAGEAETGDLSAADEKVIKFRRELEAVDLGDAG